MTVKPRRPMGRRPGRQRSAEDLVTAKKPAGRPKGEPSTIVNVQLPLTLVAKLDRYLDRLEGHTGLKANRGMIARRALELFLARLLHLSLVKLSFSSERLRPGLVSAFERCGQERLGIRRSVSGLNGMSK